MLRSDIINRCSKGVITMDALLNFYQKNSLFITLYGEKYEAILKAKEYVEDIDKTRIYINNFYEKDTDEEIYIFDNKKLLKISFDIKDSFLMTRYKVYKLENISNIELVKDTGYDLETRLILSFDGEDIELNNIEKYDLENIDDEINEKKKELNSKLLEGIFEYLIKFM